MAVLPDRSGAGVATDKILPISRLVSLIIVPFLLIAFVILYFTPQTSGTRFAWEIVPPLQAMYMGAGYLGGAVLFLHLLFGRRWHRVAAGFAPVTAFTTAMLLLTVLHWSRFDLSHLPFQLWLVLYVVTPFLIPLLWLRNRPADDGRAEAVDVIVPLAVRRALQLGGVLLLLWSALTMIWPAIAITLWVWPLSPLAARVLAGWTLLLAVGGITIGAESRWSGWVAGVQSIALWHVLFLFAAVARRDEFNGGHLLNWYVVAVLLVVGAMGVLYVSMQRRMV